MKSIIEKIKALFDLKRHKEKSETEYTDLAPIDKITNGDEYINALNWALNNDRVKNIALAGPYGAGKSSIIETYLRQHPLIEKKSLRISMATFVENVVNEDGTQKKVDIGQGEIELGILKQLFYKVDYRKIPQSRYRKLHKVDWKHVWGYLIGLIIVISLMEYIFFPDIFNSIINKICLAGASVNLTAKASLVFFITIALVILAVVAIIYRYISSHFKVKEIKLPIDATIKNEDVLNENVFDKNMDEIVYFFEETRYRLIFFEDLDRLDNSLIFVHLRELNTLLNNYDVIKEPIIFIYAVRDNVFSDTDRTKFFDFIVPVIPVINSTNSGEILLDKLNESKKMGIIHEISQDFILDVSPYIEDMRILHNIYNEFIVYKKTLRIGQDLNLSDELMMALIIFKNLYPRDFADIQIERGIIKQAFIDKQNCLRVKQGTIQDVIDKSTQVLEGISSEVLENTKELKIAFLCELTGWRGIPYRITLDGVSTINSSEFIQNDYDTIQWESVNRCSGYYANWGDGRGLPFSCDTVSKIYTSYCEREERIELIEEKRIAEEQKKVEQLRMRIHDISGWPLKRLIEQFGIEEVLSEEVRKNKFLVFLIRRGYIDEKYANYINYFKGTSITKEDMNFILAVKNMEPKPFNYILTKIPMVVQKLQIFEFEQKAIYNFTLLEYMLSSQDNKEKLNAFIEQLADEEEQSWLFIDEFVDVTSYQEEFIKLLAPAWCNMWEYIAKSVVLSYERKIHYLSRLILYADISAIVAMNDNKEMSNFIERNEDILQRLAFIDSDKVIAVIGNLHIMFNKVLTKDVPVDVLDYIFDNKCYELNQFMIHQIVEYKNKDLVHNLKTKNYTTIINLNYSPLIEYVRQNLSHYIEMIVLDEECSFDTEEQIIDLLERRIDDTAQCVRLIEHEEFCMEDITICCGNMMAERRKDVRDIWNAMLKNDKVFPTWVNVISYWAVFELTKELLTYIENHTEDLVSADSQCIGDDFKEEFIVSEVTDEVFEILLPCMQMDNFNIALDSVDESKVAIMIACKYFEFTTVRYKEIKELFPDLCVEFILQNQVDYFSEIHNIQMNSNLLESLLFSNRLGIEIAQVLLDTYGVEYMTDRIASSLQLMGLSINLDIFNAAWEFLGEPGKQKLMLEYLELLDAETMHSCFCELKRWYSQFVDRSKQHVVELENIPENMKLVERLHNINYITSYQLKKNKDYNPVKEVEKNREVIVCRVKAIK